MAKLKMIFFIKDLAVTGQFFKTNFLNIFATDHRSRLAPREDSSTWLNHCQVLCNSTAAQLDDLQDFLQQWVSNSQCFDIYF